MGLDFTALVRYGGPTPSVLESISRLEQGDADPAFAAVMACGLRHGMAFAKRAVATHWMSERDYGNVLASRPSLPSLESYLQLPSHFSLIFGRDAVSLYHCLRWIFFVTEIEWQQVMVEAVRRFCDLLGAEECIITNDAHPAVVAFDHGAPFDEALQAAEHAGEGEVAQLRDLYIDMGYDDDIVYQGPNGTYSRVPLWDSHGYWRLTLPLKQRPSGPE